MPAWDLETESSPFVTMPGEVWVVEASAINWAPGQNVEAKSEEKRYTFSTPVPFSVGGEVSRWVLTSTDEVASLIILND